MGIGRNDWGFNEGGWEIEAIREFLKIADKENYGELNIKGFLKFNRVKTLIYYKRIYIIIIIIIKII